MELKDMTPQQQLDQINKAISAVLIGGQSYRIGSRQLTRANLAELRAMKSDLMAQISANQDSSLIGDTYVAYFEGR